MSEKRVADLRAERDELVEALADLEHQRWAHWQSWVHSQGVRRRDGALVVPGHLVDRWERQIATAYADLSEQEKASDRIEAFRTLVLLDRLSPQEPATPEFQP